MSEVEKLLEKLNNLPAVEPDEWEKAAIAEAKARLRSDNPHEDLVDFAELKARVARANGRISLRVPRQLHIDLINAAANEGVSLNQYISYLLASRLR